MSNYDNADGRTRGRKLQARRLRLWTANPQCASCGRLTNYPDGFELDHIEPLCKGGEDADDNLQVLCHECHAAKTNHDLGRGEAVQIGDDGWPVEPGGAGKF